MRRLLKIAALLALAIAYVRCNPALSLAPPDSTIQLIANPCRIPSTGGVSVILAIVMKKTGLPVADGTVVQFFTNLGQIDRQGKTNDGVARVNLVSDGRSGTATVTALSGGPGSGDSATPAPRTTGADGFRALSADVTTMATEGCSGGPGTSGSASVVLGAAGAGKIIVAASPTGITRSRSSLITATVLDEDGNPVPNTGVFFSISDGKNERLASSGNAVFTDNNGQAQDVLTTNANPLTPEYPVTVDASTGVGDGGNVKVTVNAGVTATPTVP